MKVRFIDSKGTDSYDTELKGLTDDAPDYLIEAAIQAQLAPSNEIDVVSVGPGVWEIRYYSEDVETYEGAAYTTERMERL